MPVTAKIVPSLSLVYVEYIGKVNVPQAQKALRNCFASPNYRIEMNKIADLTKITELDSGFTEVLEFVKETSAQYEEKKPSTKLCIVADETVSAKAAQMFADLAAAVHHPGDIHIVPGFPEVLAILNLPDKALNSLPKQCRVEAHLLTGLPQ